MKRRINNLHKGLFKLNKSSNIIELHSKKNNLEKDIGKERDKEKDKENISINQYRFINNEEKNIKKSKNVSKYEKQHNKRKSSFNKEKEINVFENTFSDLDSSNKKSIINSKFYGNYIKSGRYFEKLRQQVIDKFISGKPLINIDRMYNNPEVKKMFGVVTDTEKTNYRTTVSNNNINNNNNSPEPEEFERDRRIPPSKIIPLIIPNNENILPMQFNDSIKNINIGQNVLLNNYIERDNNDNNLGMNLNLENINSNFDDMKGVGNVDEINQMDFNNMNKIKPFYLKFQEQGHNPKSLLFPPFPQKTNILEAKNNFQFINNNELNPLNVIKINNKTPFDLFESNHHDNFNNNGFRRKRRTNDAENINNNMMQFNGVNEQINNNQNNFYQNVNQEFREPEEINELINNLKRANDKNFNVFSNLMNDNSYFNNLMVKNSNGPNFINNNLDRDNNDIGF